MPYEHSIAFYLHNFNLFIVAMVVAIRGLSGADRFKEYAPFFPWVLLFLSAMTQGTSEEMDYKVPNVTSASDVKLRIPFNLTEAVFVLSYLCAAEKEWPKWMLDNAICFREWAL